MIAHCSMAPGVTFARADTPSPLCLFSFWGNRRGNPAGGAAPERFRGDPSPRNQFRRGECLIFARVAGKERSGRGEAEYGGRGGRSRPTGRGAGEPKKNLKRDFTQI